MSIEAMNWVWAHSPYQGAQLLLHLAMADHANDEGVMWPSVGRLARRARCSDRWVQKTIDKMRDDGFVRVERRGGGRAGGTRGRSNTYRLLFPQGAPGNGEDSSPLPTPATSPTTPNCVRTTVNCASGEPSVEAPDEPSRVWETFCTELGREPSTQSERRRWSQAIEEILRAGGTVDDVAARCREYRARRWQGLSPSSIAGNWSALAQPDRGRARSGDVETDREQASGLLSAQEWLR